MASATVDGVPTEPSVFGVQGNGGAVDKLAGTSSMDILQGNAAFNQYYGGGGEDLFLLAAEPAVRAGAHDGASRAFGDQFAYLSDFEGAGQSGGDRVVLFGFDPASLQVTGTGHSGTPGATLYYYSVSDADGHTFNFMVNSLTGQALGAGDIEFYGYGVA
jgi:hypothetical protein